MTTKGRLSFEMPPLTRALDRCPCGPPVLARASTATHQVRRRRNDYASGAGDQRHEVRDELVQRQFRQRDAEHQPEKRDRVERWHLRDPIGAID
jgi:hypothetical protein